MTDEMQPASRAATDYADFLLPHLGKQTHLLDLGCGDGELALGLAEVCGHVTALDLASDALKAAASATLGRDAVSVVQADATQLPFPDRTFDAVLVHSVLESGVEPSELLAEAWRVLRPGGTLGVASVEYGGLILAGPRVDLPAAGDSSVL